MDPSLYGVAPGTTGAVDWTSAAPIAGQTGVAAGTGAGQHGVMPILNGGTMRDTITAVWDWLNTPFNQRMSPMTIFAITGSILIAIIVWNLLLYHVRIAAEAI